MKSKKYYRKKIKKLIISVTDIYYRIDGPIQINTKSAFRRVTRKNYANMRKRKLHNRMLDLKIFTRVLLKSYTIKPPLTFTFIEPKIKIASPAWLVLTMFQVSQLNTPE